MSKDIEPRMRAAESRCSREEFGLAHSNKNATNKPSSGRSPWPKDHDPTFFPWLAFVIAVAFAAALYVL